MIIYAASSWKNEEQPGVVAALREAGHDVYDFRNPREGDHGFSWREVDPSWKSWDLAGWARGVEHPAAVRGHSLDMAALERADLCVLVLPAGRDASWEYGYHCGMRRAMGIVYQAAGTVVEPGLMFRGSVFVSDLSALVGAAAEHGRGDHHLVGAVGSIARADEVEARRLLAAGMSDEGANVALGSGLYLCLRCGRGSRRELWGPGRVTCPRCRQLAPSACQRLAAASALAAPEVQP